MVSWPHTYYINKWFASSSEGTAPMYRTNNLDDFLVHVEKEIKSNKLNSSNSRFIVRGDKTFFSYYSDNGECAWSNARYFSSPEKVYSTFDDYKKSVSKELRSICQSSQEERICMIA